MLQKKVLIIEDDFDIANLVKINLSDIGCDCDIAGDGLSGIEYALSNNYDVIILDMMLPKLDGLEVCQRLRKNHILVPILMLTSRSEEDDKVTSLNAGADDYITKPFSIRELTARVIAHIRRYRPEKEPSFINSKKTFLFDGLCLDTENHKVTLASKEIEITAKEFDLLSLFMKNPGRTYSRTELLDLVWGASYSGYEHTVNSHINRLRMKIEENPAKPKYILTVWGVGYKFNNQLKKSS
ncbi:two component transcriptional regulator, winged helix family [Chloroherpeton thalassium ATCC 35110]|uniref:Phosphate regulon transcriptional regulatory protein PhoB n=1 Tax=Chloroherpeton thalassium (strain ATCC 35110 / GB-78) TaxID=517418 RepID=B3QW38_CHLT3|nr:response regulator transcription factor [Chloroherpeton thalassium]ACF14692.1 two component transcriptional regulator, winged helix family [Chloroherpeton thalassium ATCC 35110]